MKTLSDRLADHCTKATETYLNFGWDAYIKFSDSENDPVVRLAGTMCVRACQDTRQWSVGEDYIERLRRLA